MTMIDLLDEASWLYPTNPITAAEERIVPLVLNTSRTMRDLRRLLALARDAEGLRGAVTAADALSKALRAWVLSGVQVDDWPRVRAFGLAYEKARAALEGTDR